MTNKFVYISIILLVVVVILALTILMPKTAIRNSPISTTSVNTTSTSTQTKYTQQFSFTYMDYGITSAIANGYNYTPIKIITPSNTSIADISQINLTGEIVSNNQSEPISAYLATESQYDNWTLNQKSSPEYGKQYTYYFGYTGGIGGVEPLMIYANLQPNQTYYLVFLNQYYNGKSILFTDSQPIKISYTTVT